MDITILSLMHSLDQAFLVRQGHAAQGDCTWGECFFKALDNLYPAWSSCQKEVYVAASELLSIFSHPETHPEIRTSLAYNPQAFVRMVVLILGSAEWTQK
jgi:hypothetical protein